MKPEQCFLSPYASQQRTTYTGRSTRKKEKKYVHKQIGTASVKGCARPCKFLFQSCRTVTRLMALTREVRGQIVWLGEKKQKAKRRRWRGWRGGQRGRHGAAVQEVKNGGKSTGNHFDCRGEDGEMSWRYLHKIPCQVMLSGQHRDAAVRSRAACLISVI